ncbi:cytochrome c biogenesis protein ResB [uncultured Sunxiuqinia sp.]|uniref:cytochrome c biogenesis protein ResB n=1 Tax=uncultured Sunxiuqinia sp. TaxID=1573825 RepID=UPI002AA67195|nr:cytochrome c biogenesis protein ResB [uncultured Sunxiuqinia sp.]
MTKKSTWQTPWSYREGWIVVGGMAILGIVWQAFLPSLKLQIPTWPGNLVLGLLFITILLAIHFFYKKSALNKWLSSVPAAVTSAAFYCGLAILMGIIPQHQQSPSLIIDLTGLNQLTNSWLFVLANVYFLSSLGLATLKRLIPFKLKNTGYILNHLGLWIALTASALGSSDLQRLSMNCQEGQPEWRATNQRGQMVELPIAIELLNFSIDEYPPKLALIDNETGKVVTEGKKNQYFSVVEAPFKLLSYNVEVEKLLGEAGLIGNRFERVYEIGSPPAAQLKVTHTKTGETANGWVSPGSFRQQPYAFKISGEHSIVMLPPEPQKYQSAIRILTQDGQQLETTLEVNKPFKLGGWKLYQLSYDTEMGKWSTLSVIELVRDPWIPAVYLGIFMLLAGTLFLFRDGTKKRKEQL